MSSFKEGFLNQLDPVAEIFSRPPQRQVAGDKSSIGKERFEISALPSRDSSQTNWNYHILNHDGENKMMVNLGDRTYQWQLPKDFPELEKLSGMGGSGIMAHRLTDIDGHYAKEMLEKAKILSKGRLQVHRSSSSRLYATIQDGKTNPTFDLTHDKNNNWNFTPKKRPTKPDPAQTLVDIATAKKAGIKAALAEPDKDYKWGLYYFEGRNTGIAARSEEEARKKKRRGGDNLTAVRTPTESEKKDMAAGRWVRTRADGQPPGKSSTEGRGLGPPPKSYRKEAGLQQIVSAREAQEDWGLKERLREALLSRGEDGAASLAPAAVAAQTAVNKGLSGEKRDQVFGQLREVLSGNRPPVTTMDHIMRPIYTPTGFNPMVGAGVAAGMGAIGGGIYHFMKERAAKADATITGKPHQPGSALKRTLVGAGIGAGTSLLSNYILHKVPGDGTPIVDTMKNPFPDFKPQAPSGSLKVSEAKEASFNVVDAMTMGSDDMDVVGKSYLKRMIMVEPGLTFDDKLRLMGQVDTADRTSNGLSPSEVIGPGVGALTGFLMAKSRGSGPVTTGIMTGIGGFAGHMLYKDRGPKPGDPAAGQPGFKMY